jgi:penicillin-binding protein 1B
VAAPDRLGRGIAAFAAGFTATAYFVSLDHVVRARFEGTQFRVPSRVYSAPAIPYPGLDWRNFGLWTRSRLGYRAAASSKDLPPGVRGRDRACA